MPDLVRPVVDVPGGEVMTVVEETRAPNAEQLAAIDPELKQQYEAIGAADE